MPCKNHTYKGNYGFTVMGTVIDPSLATAPTGPMQPFAVVGRFHADGKGNITGSQTRNFEGTTTDETYTETYTVKADCTSVSTKVTSTGKKVTFAFVVLHRGKTIIGIETDPQKAVVLRAERID